MRARAAPPRPSSITGTIEATSSFAAGVYLYAGGSVTNQAGGIIDGPDTGIGMYMSGTVVNSGTVVGTSDYGIRFETTGSVTNASGGLIKGGIAGVEILGTAGTVGNYGTIQGTGTSSKVLSSSTAACHQWRRRHDQQQRPRRLHHRHHGTVTNSWHDHGDREVSASTSVSSSLWAAASATRVA